MYEGKSEETLYFEHDPTGQFLKVEKGDSLDFLNTDIFDPRTKEQYEHYITSEKLNQT